MADRATCIPLHIGAGPSDTGPRLGGRAPADVAPDAGAGADYLLTIPLVGDGKAELSLFLAGDDEPLLECEGKLTLGAPVHAVVHGASRRSDRNESASNLSEHPLWLDQRRGDWMRGAEGLPAIESGHKLGGRPYCVVDDPDRDRLLELLGARGVVQVLQLDSPGVEGDEGVVDGEWPFLDGIFHLFGAAPFACADWYWFWEH